MDNFAVLILFGFAIGTLGTLIGAGASFWKGSGPSELQLEKRSKRLA